MDHEGRHTFYTNWRQDRELLFSLLLLGKVLLFFIYAGHYAIRERSILEEKYRSYDIGELIKKNIVILLTFEESLLSTS